MTTVSWQEEICQRLEERDLHEKSLAGIIEQYRRLARQTAVLRERNRTLLKAASTVRAQGPGAAAAVAGNNPVQAAYVTSLESQIASLREELADVYKTQGQNAQRLIKMNDDLRAKEEQARADEEELRMLRLERDKLLEKTRHHEEVVREKERALQFAADEYQGLNLEYNQLNEKNTLLKKDNASLLKRWLDLKNSEAEQMNAKFAAEEAVVNDKKKKASSPSPGTSVSGNGNGNSSGSGGTSKAPSPNPGKAASVASVRTNATLTDGKGKGKEKQTGA